MNVSHGLLDRACATAAAMLASVGSTPHPIENHGFDTQRPHLASHPGRDPGGRYPGVGDDHGAAYAVLAEIEADFVRPLGPNLSCGAP